MYSEEYRAALPVVDVATPASQLQRPTNHTHELLANIPGYLATHHHGRAACERVGFFEGRRRGWNAAYAAYPCDHYHYHYPQWRCVTHNREHRFE